MAGLSKLVTWTNSRRQESLNGSWNSIIDVYDVGASGPFGGDEFFAEMFGFPGDRGLHSPGRRAEYDFNTSDPIEVPGDWNTQYERFHFYEGSMWFRRRFKANPAAENGRRTIVVMARFAWSSPSICFKRRRANFVTRRMVLHPTGKPDRRTCATTRRTPLSCG
jgi:hypothetical protein